MQVLRVMRSQPDGGELPWHGLQLENVVGTSVEEGCVRAAIISPALEYYKLNGINIGIFCYYCILYYIDAMVCRRFRA